MRRRRAAGQICCLVVMRRPRLRICLYKDYQQVALVGDANGKGLGATRLAAADKALNGCGSGRVASVVMWILC